MTERADIARKFARITLAVVIGLLCFGVIMGGALAVINVNARLTPAVPWFPVPAGMLLVLLMLGAERYWGIGLRWTPAGARLQVYTVGLLLTWAGVAACAVQGWFTDYTRATELLDLPVGPAFKFVYAIFMAVFAAVLAEIVFRGIIQTRLQTMLGVWSLVFTIAVINVLAHRWGPEITRNGIGLFVVLAAWTYLRWYSGSVWPPLICHAATNLIVALVLWFGGPIAHAEESAVVVALLALSMVLSIIVGLKIGRSPVVYPPA